MKSSTEEPTRLQDFIALTKPGITKMCVMMTAGGYGLAYASTSQAKGWSGLDWWALLLECVLVLFGSTLVVGGSCALNMVLERDRDRLMERTAKRALPAGRMEPWEATVFGLLITVIGLALLAWAANVLTAVLAAFAWISYVAVYTPLKGRTPMFLLVGTIPGAIPPLLGWTAVTGRIDAIGVTLFTILVAWQLPHFIALSFMCHNDYARAGIHTVPIVRGDVIARQEAFGYSLLLLPSSLLLVPLQAAGWLYAIVALIGSSWMIWIAFKGMLQSVPPKWAQKLFFASLIYLPLLTLALLFDRVLEPYL